MLKKRELLIYWIMAFFLIVFNSNLSYAVTGTPGSTIKVTYSINSPDGGDLSTVTGKIDYDDKILELVSISSSAGVAGNGRVSATESQINGTSMSVTATYKIKSSAEDTTVTTKLNVSELYTKNSENNHSTTVTGNVTVKTTSNSSNNTATNTSNQGTQNNSETTENSNLNSNSMSGVNTSSNSNSTYNVNTNTNASDNSNTNSNLNANTVKEVAFKSTDETMYTANRVNLRTQYGTSGIIAKTLAEGEELTRTGYSTTNVDGYSWSRVKYKGVTYYCITKSLTATKPEREEQDGQNTTVNEIVNNSNAVTENATNTTNATNETTNEITQIAENKNEKGDLTKLEVEGYTLSPKFDSTVYEYTVDIQKDVSSLNIKAESNKNVEIEIAGNNELTEEENVITIICYNKETKQNSTYQIIVNKIANQNPHAEAIEEGKQKRSLIIKIGIALLVILIILCIVVFRKSNEEYDEDDADEEEMYTEEETEKRKRPTRRGENRDVTERNKQRKKSSCTEEQRSLEEGNIYVKRERRVLEKKDDGALRDTNEDFEEKLERIKRKQRRQEKGGKHF